MSDLTNYFSDAWAENQLFRELEADAELQASVDRRYGLGNSEKIFVVGTPMSGTFRVADETGDRL